LAVSSCWTNAGVTRNTTKTLEQKMGLPPARAKIMSVAVNPEARRWLSLFFAGIVNKTEKSGTVPAVGYIQIQGLTLY